jgi:nuclear autoantigenic sperm protein
MDDSQADSNNQTDLQIAWEMLELARLVFNRLTGKENKLNEAEAHLRLAEIGLETGQYEQAVGDIQQCLAIQMSVLEPDDRLLAETYYSLALALAQAERFDDAVAQFREASSVLQRRIANIRQRLEASSETTDTSKDRQEINDLEAILPDIQSRIQDLEESKQALKQLAAEALGIHGHLDDNSVSKPESKEQTGTGASASKPISDISHLVKRKRKASTDSTELNTKQARSED